MKRLAFLLLLMGCASEPTAPADCHQTMIAVQLPDTLRVGADGRGTVQAVDLLAASATVGWPLYRYVAVVCH